jgi:branched-chain amino acid aminotransferase
VPKSQAAVSVYDHGLLYGDGVFEGIRVYRGKIFKCKQHMDRLWQCAERIQAWRSRLPGTRWSGSSARCIEANEHRRRVHPSGRHARRGRRWASTRPTARTPGIICIADQIALYPPELYEKGMKVVVAKRPRVPIACLDPRVKSLNYLNNIMAKCEAIDRGLLEAIMLNTEGWVSECTGDNIFIVKDGTLFTPPSEAGILEGITRELRDRDALP